MGISAAAIGLGRGRIIVACLRIRAAHTALVLTAAVRLGGTRVIVASLGVKTAEATREVATAVVHIGVRIVVAGDGIRATGHFEIVADSVLVGVRKAVAVAIHGAAGRVGALTGVHCGRRLVVACRGIRAADAAQVLAASIALCSRCIIVAGGRIEAAQAAREVATSIVHVGVLVVVARRRIHAARHLQRIADAVAVGILQTIAVAVDVLVGRERTLTAVDGGSGIVVAGTGIGAAHARLVVAAAVIDDRVRVVIARHAIRTSCAARALAAAVIDGRLAVEVACERIGTTRRLILVTGAVGIHVVQAIAITILVGLSVLAAAIRNGGRSIVVARCRVCTARA